MSGATRRGRNLLILGGILLVLLGSCAYLQFQARQGAGAKTAPDPPPRLISRLDEARIARLVLESPQGKLTLVQRDGAWNVDAPYPVKLDPVALYGLVANFTALRAREVIDPRPGDLAPYGLARPALTASAVLTDGTERRYALGDLAPSGAGYYLKAPADPAVYLIAASDGRKFRYSLADLRDRELPAVAPERLNYFKLSRSGGAAIEIVPDDSAGGGRSDSPLSVWKMVQPYREPKPVNSDRFKPVLDALAGLSTLTEVVADHPADLAPYGLAPARAELIAGDGQTRLHLLIGKKRDAEQVYCKLADEARVFTLPQAGLAFVETRPFDLIERFVCLVNIDAVERIEVAAAGRTRTIAIVRKPSAAAGGEAAAFRVDGKAVAAAPFRKYYQSLIGLMAEAENDRGPARGAPEVRTSFFLRQGPQGERRVLAVNYLPYNADFYAVERDGRTEFLISREQVREMLRRLEALARGR
jgi:hypothetical protein